MADKRFLGPVPRGFDVEIFRTTGRLVKIKPTRFAGPVRPGFDVEVFRRTGRSVRVKSEEQKRREAEAKRRAAEEEQRRQEALAKERVRKIREQQEKLRREERQLRAEKTIASFRRRQQIERQLKFLSNEITRTFIFTKGAEAITTAQLRQLSPSQALEFKGKVIAEKLTKGTPLTQIELRTARTLERLAKKKNPTATERATILALEAAGFFQAVGFGLMALPGVTLSILRDPRNIVPVGKGIVQGFIDEGATIVGLWKIDKGRALVRIGANLFVIKGTTSGISFAGRLSSRAFARVSRQLKKVSPKGTITLKTATGKPFVIKRGGSVSTLAEPLAKQAALAGKRVTAVSTQAQKLVGVLKRKKIVRKPIPLEKTFTKRTKLLLRRFDQRKITKAQLIELDRLVIKESGGAANILERAFFADPRGRFRPSRLGIQREASFKDILKGDFTFRSQTPQILTFVDVTVQKFPKALKGIERKLRTGKPLTKAEGQKLIEFQLKKGGKFKPIGKLTREPEITLAPGEIVKRVRKLGSVEVNGKIVPIIQAKVVKPTATTKKLLAKGKKGTLTRKEFKKLRRNVKKESGGVTQVTTRVRRVKPRVRLPKRFPSRVRRVKRPVRIPKRPKKPKRPGRPPKRPTPKKPVKPLTPSQRKAFKRVVKKPIRPGVPITAKKRRALRKAKTKKFLAAMRRKRKKKKKKKTRSYDVFVRPLKKKKAKKKPRQIKVTKAPIKKKKAVLFRNFLLDQSLARRGKIVPRGLKPKKLDVRIPTKSLARKFRKFKRVKGRKKPLPKHNVIERKRFVGDTRSELRGLTARQRLAQLRRKSKSPPRASISKSKGRRTPKRKISALQRRILLARLQKARRVLAMKRKKKKRK